MLNVLQHHFCYWLAHYPEHGTYPWQRRLVELGYVAAGGVCIGSPKGGNANGMYIHHHVTVKGIMALEGRANQSRLMTRGLVRRSGIQMGTMGTIIQKQGWKG